MLPGTNPLRTAAIEAREVLRLLRRPTLGLSKTEVLAARIKLDALAVQGAAQRRDLTEPVDLLGYTMHYAHFGLFRFLFEEVFLHEDYFFETDMPAPFIIDAGSNIGMSTLYFKKLYPNARITGFEALPPTFEVLRRNVETNALRDVTIHNLALAAEPGISVLHYDPRRAGSLTASTVGVSSATETEHACEIPNALLSEFIDAPVDLLKLDVEGAEDAVLQELAASGKLPHVRAMIFEYHHHLSDFHEQTPSGRDTFSETLSLLEQAGFGYLIDASYKRPGRPGASQNFLVFAYAKEAYPHLAAHSGEASAA